MESAEARLPGANVAPPNWSREALLGLLFVGGYLGLDWISYIHPMQQFSITPWNPQPALAIALLFVKGQRWIPVVFAAVLMAEWIVRGAPTSLGSTLLIGAVLALGYAAIAQGLKGRFAVDPALATRRDTLRLVGVVATGALATGILYLAALLSSNIGPLDSPFTALVRFWIGDMVGILVTLPFLLMLSVKSRRRELAEMLRSGETGLHAGFASIALVLVFSAPPEAVAKYFYVLFLPLVFITARFGLVGSTVATVVIQAAVIAAGEIAHYQPLTVFELQALLIALTVTGLFLGVTVDERRRAEEELRRSMRLAAAGEMAAALAHELNQPLTAVASYARASLLIAEAPRPDEGLLAQTLGKLVAEATRAAEVVRRLRDFFRTGAMRLVPVSLADLARVELERARAGADAAGVTLQLRAGTALPRILGDETQLQVVLRNLIANAIQAAAPAEPPRLVTLEVRETAGSMIVVVEDTGPGVSTSDLERIFAPFETGRAAGMGMGLAISRAIAEAHGGRLWVEAAGHGSFRLTLPMGEQANE